MEIIKIDFEKPKDEDIERIAHYIKKGKVIVYPTDTIYGIGCDATNEKATERVRKIKKRDSQKPFLVLVKSWCQFNKYFHVSRKQNEILRKKWPGPISVILKQRGLFPRGLAAGKKLVAVRLPKSDFLIKILKKADLPIISTSLNLGGKKPLKNVKNIEKYFKKEKPDLVVDIGRSLKGRPSRLIDLTDINNIKILRR